MKEVIQTFEAAAISIGIIFGAAVGASAHGDAEWIRQGPYYDRFGAHCCGPTDCAVAQPGEMSRIEGGWKHAPSGAVLMDREKGNYRSIDTQMWRCFLGGTLKCVFVGEGT